MIRIAVCGSNGYAWHMLQYLLKLHDLYQVEAVFELPGLQTPGKEYCSDNNIPVYEDFDQMLSELQGRCDVIYLPTPPHTHLPLATKCLRAWYHVFMEKPPVPTIQGIDELISIRNRNGRRLAVCFQALYNNVVQTLKKYAVEGDFGKIHNIHFTAAWHRSDAYFNRSKWSGKLQVGGEWVLDGPLHNALAHGLADALFLASPKLQTMAKPASVQAELYHGQPIEGEDTNCLRIQTMNDVTVMFFTSFCVEKDTEVRLILESDKARVEYIDFQRAVIHWKDGKTEQLSLDGDIRENMLRRLAADFEQGNPFPGDLEVCRPFVLAVNTAYESSGKVHPIQADYVQRLPKDDTMATVIDGIEQAIRQCDEQGKLFSELNLPWAVPTRTLDTSGYTHFPSLGFTRS